jgi:hypothetical protein
MQCCQVQRSEGNFEYTWRLGNLVDHAVPIVTSGDTPSEAAPTRQLLTVHSKWPRSVPDGVRHTDAAGLPTVTSGAGRWQRARY